MQGYLASFTIFATFIHTYIRLLFFVLQTWSAFSIASITSLTFSFFGLQLQKIKKAISSRLKGITNEGALTWLVEFKFIKVKLFINSMRKLLERVHDNLYFPHLRNFKIWKISNINRIENIQLKVKIKAGLATYTNVFANLNLSYATQKWKIHNSYCPLTLQSCIFQLTQLNFREKHTAPLRFQ